MNPSLNLCVLSADKSPPGYLSTYISVPTFFLTHTQPQYSLSELYISFQTTTTPLLSLRNTHTHLYQTLLLKAQRQTQATKIGTSWDTATHTQTHRACQLHPLQTQLPRWKNKWGSCVGLFEFLLLEKLGQGAASGFCNIYSFKKNSHHTYTVLLKVTSYSQNWMTA